MMKSSKLAIASAALMSVMSAANAQDTGAVAQGGAATGGHGMMCRAYERVEGQLSFLKTELRITTGQEPQWNVFANIFRTNKEKQLQTCRTAQEQSRSMISASLPDSIKIKEDQLSDQLEALRVLDAALQPLYSSLSKEQKKTADEILKGVP
jgi:periplasmic protein CpxP/Spy